MSKVKYKLLSAFLVLVTACFSAAANGPDKTLRVAGVKTVSMSSFERNGFETELANLETAMLSTGIETINQLTIDIWRGVNTGSSAPYLVHSLDNLASAEIHNKSKETVADLIYDPSSKVSNALRAYRDQIDADILVLAVKLSSSSSCGVVPTTGSSWAESPVFWTPSAATGGTDQTNSENSYIVIVNTDCFTSSFKFMASAHEFSHIAGGNHFTETSPSRQGVLTGNKARAFVRWNGYLASAGASPGVDKTPGGANFTVWKTEYSNNDGILPLGSFNHTNRAAVRLTSPSIAAYRPKMEGTPIPPTPNPPSPPGCGLQAPIYVTASLSAICTSGGFSRYRMQWYDLCPGASTYYQIFVRQGTPNPVYVTDVFSSATNVFVRVDPAYVSVKACNAGLCSSLSSEVRIDPRC